MGHIEAPPSLPSYPKVEVIDQEIFIILEKGDRYYWGKEENPQQAEKVAEQMELELRGYEYSKTELKKTIKKIVNSLNHWGLEKEKKDILFMSQRHVSETQKAQSLDKWLGNTEKSFRIKILEVHGERLSQDECKRGLEALEKLKETLRMLKGWLIAEIANNYRKNMP